MENLRKELCELIEERGTSDPWVLDKSQELDKLINQKMRGEGKLKLLLRRVKDARH